MCLGEDAWCPPSLGQKLQGHIPGRVELSPSPSFLYRLLPCSLPPVLPLRPPAAHYINAPPTPPSAAGVVPTTVPAPVTTKPPIVGCPCVAAAQGSQSPQPPCPRGAQASRRRARAALCFCPRGNRVVHSEYLDPSIHPSASSFFFIFSGRTPRLVGF